MLKEQGIQKNTYQKEHFKIPDATYRQMASKAKVSIDYIERFLKQKGWKDSFDPDSKVAEASWNIMKGFIKNKLKMNKRKKKRQKMERPAKVVRPTFSNHPLPEYVGGNFGKLIFTGKTN